MKREDETVKQINDDGKGIEKLWGKIPDVEQGYNNAGPEKQADAEKAVRNSRESQEEKHSYQIKQQAGGAIPKTALKNGATLSKMTGAVNQLKKIPEDEPEETAAEEIPQNTEEEKAGSDPETGLSAEAVEISVSAVDEAEAARKDAVYNEAKRKMTGAIVSRYEQAIVLMQSVSGWRDADAQIAVCRKRIEEIKAKTEAECLEHERQEQLARERVKRIKKIRKTVFCAFCAVVVFIVLLTAVIIPNKKYNKAVDLMERGMYDSAVSVFLSLDGYKDSRKMIRECQYRNAKNMIGAGDIVRAYEILSAISLYKDSAEIAEEIYPACVVAQKVEEIRDADIGDSVFFGTYEQDNDLTNGQEEIEWIVLAREEDKVLLLSKYGLEGRQYHSRWEAVTWETCDLRKWLNGDFIDTAFNEHEKAVIPTVEVLVEEKLQSDTDPEKNVQDKVFLLSSPEAELYLDPDSARVCCLTEYARANGAYSSKNGGCWWWLRTRGLFTNDAIIVLGDGEIYDDGDAVDETCNAVRPAVWISLNG